MQRFRRKRIAIDLGSRHIRIASTPDFEISEDVFVAALLSVQYKKKTAQRLVGVGKEIRLDAVGAEKEKDGDIELVWPVRQGRVTDYVVTQGVLRHFLAAKRIKVSGHLSVIGPMFDQTVISVPCSGFDAEARIRRDLTRQALNNRGKIGIAEDMLAIWASQPDLAVDAEAVVIISLGAGASQIGVVEAGELKSYRFIPYGGDKIDEHLQQHIWTEDRQWIDLDLCRLTKEGRGSLEEGRHYFSEAQSAENAPISDSDLRIVLGQAMQPIVTELRWFLNSPDTVQRLHRLRYPIQLAGGMANLPGVDRWLAQELDVPVQIVPQPEQAVIRGMIAMLGKV